MTGSGCPYTDHWIMSSGMWSVFAFPVSIRLHSDPRLRDVDPRMHGSPAFRNSGERVPLSIIRLPPFSMIILSANSGQTLSTSSTIHWRRWISIGWVVEEGEAVPLREELLNRLQLEFYMKRR